MLHSFRLYISSFQSKPLSQIPARSKLKPSRTNGRGLEEMDDIFGQSKSIFDTVRIAKSMPNSRRVLDEENESETIMAAVKSAVTKDTPKVEVSKIENIH